PHLRGQNALQSARRSRVLGACAQARRLVRPGRGGIGPAGSTRIVADMSMHANLQPVAALVGTWRGPGNGHYPTITDFSYTEELTFTDVGKPFLAYLQRTWSPDGTPMHTESGFLRVPGPETVEMTLAQPTGQTELA